MTEGLNINENMKKLEAIPVSAVSDTMVKRDNFFHSCWMELKRRHPDMWEQQSEIELYVSGYERPDAKDPDDDDSENEQGTVM